MTTRRCALRVICCHPRALQPLHRIVDLLQASPSPSCRYLLEMGTISAALTWRAAKAAVDNQYCSSYPPSSPWRCATWVQSPRQSANTTSRWDSAHLCDSNGDAAVSSSHSCPDLSFSCALAVPEKTLRVATSAAAIPSHT